MKKKTYLQIGPYSSVGGVNIHIIRLSNLFENDFCFEYIDESPIENRSSEVFNIRSKNIIKYLRIIKNADLVHIHTGIWWLRCVHIFFAKLLFRKVIVTVHSMSNLQTKLSVTITRLFLNLANQTIVVSTKIANDMKLHKALVIPAFLPPILEQEQELPKEILNILHSNLEKKIIISNAFELVFHQGEDLYGLDLLIEVAKKIKKDNKNYFILFVIASTKKETILDSYNTIIKNEDLKEKIAIYLGSISFVKLILKSDLVIRATNTDGDAITVREALYLNKPVIASDIVKRPNEAVLFKSRDSSDLYKKISTVFSNNEFKENILLDDTSENYKNLYQSIFDKL